MKKIDRFARRVGLSFRPDETRPTDAFDWLEDQLVEPRLDLGIASLESHHEILKWPEHYNLSITERYELSFRYDEEKRRNEKNKSLNSSQIKAQNRRWARENLPNWRDETRFYHRAVYSPDQVRQRLVHFWANHFFVSIGFSGEGMMVADHIERAIESNLDNTFETMLWNVTTSPAMTNYLDNHVSAGERSDHVRWAKKKGKQAGLNDNLARELLELHTVTPEMKYTEADIHNVAKVLSGWGMDITGRRKNLKDYTGAFEHSHNKKRAERGKIKVFGLTLGSQFGTNEKALPDLINYLAKHPLTARHLSEKLCTHFISDVPSESDIALVQNAWNQSGGSLPEVHRTVTRLAWDRLDHTTKFTWPMTWLMQAIRSSGASILDGWDDVHKKINERHVSQVWKISRELGQGFWFGDLQPNGFSLSKEDWVSAAHLERRLKFARLIGERGNPLIGPEKLAKENGVSREVLQNLSALDNPNRWVFLLCCSEFLEV